MSIRIDGWRGNLLRLAFAGLLFLGASGASAQEVVARISISEQTMMVFVDNALSHVWPVSTARKGYKTPHGSYAPYWLDKNHRSRIYKNAPMPFSIFFKGNYAVHGTTEVARLGRPASHGCVRLLTQNAEILYRLVETYGKENSRIVVVP